MFIVGPHGVPDPPSLAQCTSISELKIDSGAPPGGQIYQYVLFPALFESPTKDMAQKYGSTVKNLTLGFSPKLSGELLYMYGSQEQILANKSMLNFSR